MLIRGPTLIDLQEVYQTSIEIISLSLTGAAVGGIFGNLIGKKELICQKFKPIYNLSSFQLAMFGASFTSTNILLLQLQCLQLP